MKEKIKMDYLRLYPHFFSLKSICLISFIPTILLISFLPFIEISQDNIKLFFPVVPFFGVFYTYLLLLSLVSRSATLKELKSFSMLYLFLGSSIICVMAFIYFIAFIIGGATMVGLFFVPWACAFVQTKILNSLSQSFLICEQNIFDVIRVRIKRADLLIAHLLTFYLIFAVIFYKALLKDLSLYAINFVGVYLMFLIVSSVFLNLSEEISPNEAISLKKGNA